MPTQRVLLLRSNQGCIKSADPWEFVSKDQKGIIDGGSTSHTEVVNFFTSKGWRLVAVVPVRRGQHYDTEFWLTIDEE